MIERCAFCLWFCCFSALTAGPLPPNLFDRLEWRNIGPFRAGRVVAVCGVAGDPATYYFGSVGGGVWKTANAGTTWTPIFDQQPVASIGAIAVAPSNPDVIYVGTGETDIRSSIGFGDGVYKSTDSGKTWKNIGLRDTRQIAKILVDPANPDLVYVAALGHAYGPNEERGVFRSVDGGATWKKVLYTSSEVGAVDLAWEPEHPRVLFATMWNGRRSVWSQYAPIEGPGSGLWRTDDAGDHWTRIEGHGLPAATWRRSAVAVANGGKRVYLLVDASKGAGLYRSDDGGNNWTPTSTDPRITARAWYFSTLTLDPQNPDVVYVPNVGLYRSADSGLSWTVLKGSPGGDDYHALWIDPKDPRRMLLGSDQGTNVSFDRGATWSTWYNQPTAQMYHVTTDNRFPYFVYGAQQDSGTAAVASRTDRGEIDARDWFSVGGAEAGYIAVDPRNPDIYYVGNTYGILSRFDRRSGQSQNITPWPVRAGGPAGTIAQQKYRFPWTAALVFSPLDPATLYYGSQYLLKTVDGGLSWNPISPDLTGDTRRDKDAPVVPASLEQAKELGYGVIYSIAPSPVRAGIIWAGTDTGLIHLTRDGGANWANVTPAGLPVWSKVTHIEASHFDPAVAYAAVDRHRLEDYNPYVYRTRDFGKTWTLAAEGLVAPAYLNCVREDPRRKGLLYAATELGVAVSFDDGDHWQSLQLNLPAVSVRDLVVHGDDLVIGTHGRGFWILDDASPLRQAPEADGTEAFLFKPAAAIRMSPDSFFGTPLPPEEPQAKNPPDGAMIDFFLKAAPQGPVTLEILDGRGSLVRRFSTTDRPPAPPAPGTVSDLWREEPPRLTARTGMNRFVWDLRYGSPGGEDASDEDSPRPNPGPRVLPGIYKVRFQAGDVILTQPLTVKLDPRSRATPLELSRQFQLSRLCARAIGEAETALHGLRNIERQLQERRGGAPAEVAAKIAELLYDAEKLLGAGDRPSAPELPEVSRSLSAALSVAQSADRTPPASAYTIYAQSNRALSELLVAWKRLRDVDIPALNRMLEGSKLPLIEPN